MAKSSKSKLSPAAARVVASLERFLAANWERQPRDVAALRRHKRPPMGNLPCVIYANFDTFWLGEMTQVMHAQARARAMPVKQLNAMAAAIIARHAARLGKWGFADTVRELGAVQAFFAGPGARSHAEFAAVAEALLVALDRINTWIDAAIPWSRLDRALKLCPVPA